MNDAESTELAARLLKELGDSSDVTVAVFFNALGYGMFDEWDCELGSAFTYFGEAEFLLAARTGALYAQAWAVKEGAIEGSIEE